MAGDRPGRPIRLLIVDDHPVVRDGLRGLFADDPDFQVVGEAGNGAEAVARVERLGADVVLMDLRMPEMDGVEAIRGCAGSAPGGAGPGAHHLRHRQRRAARDRGRAPPATCSRTPPETSCSGPSGPPAGEAVLSPAVASRLMGQVRKPPPEALSQRELEVLALIADGATNREAAAKLFISEATVKTHLLHIYEKLGVRDRAAAVAEAFRRRLLT